MKKFFDYLKEHPTVVACLLAFAVGLWIGYSRMPAKVETRIEYKQVNKTQTDKSTKKDNDKVVTIVERKLPDGTVTKETVIQDKSKTSTDSETRKDVEISKVEEKTVTYNSGWSFRLLYGLDTDGTQRYGLGVDKRLIGPFTLGAFGITGTTLGLSLGVTF
jgi:hypothetical protein